MQTLDAATLDFWQIIIAASLALCSHSGAPGPSRTPYGIGNCFRVVAQANLLTQYHSIAMLYSSPLKQSKWKEDWRCDAGITMNAERLEHFRSILLKQLREHAPHIRADQEAALELSDSGVNDPADLSVIDVNKEIAWRLGERESQLVADIDQALLRIKEGSYGICARCGKLIEERRLEALPTARYDANCQAAIEADNGEDEHASL